jgi:hypothetical protein
MARILGNFLSPVALTYWPKCLRDMQLFEGLLRNYDEVPGVKVPFEIDLPILVKAF